MRAFGFSEAAIAEFLATRPAGQEGLFDVHPHNVFAVKLALAMGTQWNTAVISTMSFGRVIRTGLKYENLERTARWESLGEISTDDFRRVRIFEAEALAAWSEAAR